MSDERATDLIGGLNDLRRDHRWCEDCFYSCPKAEDGCCDDRQGDECNCGADAHNAIVDRLIADVEAGAERYFDSRKNDPEDLVWYQKQVAFMGEEHRAVLASQRELRAENDRLRAALQRIANEDYRGNRPQSAFIAAAALSAREEPTNDHHDR